jgi:PKD repeat protein
MSAINQISRANLLCPSFSPNFTADATQSCEVNLTVNFTDNSVGATSWAWDVDGDDITDYTTQNVTHTYGVTGEFDVALTISDSSVNASKVKIKYIKVGAIEMNTSTVTLSLTLDDNPDETSWEFVDGNNTVVYSGGPYTGFFDANTTKTETFTINPNECYYFKISDSASDGICCSTGNGLYELRADDNSLLITGGDFNSNTTHNLYSGTLSVNDFSTQVIELFPNPTSGRLTIKSQSLPDSYIIYNALGQVLKQSQMTSDIELNINVQNLNNGIYFIKLNKGNSSQVLSFIKN